MTTRSFAASFLLILFSTAGAAQWQPPEHTAEPGAGNPAVRASSSDPVGDIFNPGPDLAGIFAQTDGADLVLRLDFDGFIERPPGSGNDNEVVGFIDIDSDQQAATGLNGGNVTAFCPAPPAEFGVDFVVNLGTFDPGTNTVVLQNDAGIPVGAVPIAFTSNRLTVTIPNALISDDGIVNVNTVIGNIAAPTDCAPDGAVLTSDQSEGIRPAPASVPAMSSSSLVVLAFGLLMSGFMLRRYHAG